MTKKKKREEEEERKREREQYYMDKIQLQNHLQPKATNCSNKLTCVKNGMYIAHDYLSKLNPTNPS